MNEIKEQKPEKATEQGGQVERIVSQPVTIKGRLTNIGHDYHFSDATTLSQDKLAGDIMSYVIGDLFINCNFDAPSKQWETVCKALRVHGFNISFTG